MNIDLSGFNQNNRIDRYQIAFRIFRLVRFRLKTILIYQSPTLIRLQSREPKIVRPITPDNEIYRRIAEIADSVEQDDGAHAKILTYFPRPSLSRLCVLKLLDYPLRYKLV
jgi:hypothetical protein